MNAAENRVDERISLQSPVDNRSFREEDIAGLSMQPKANTQIGSIKPGQSTTTM
jgi:hypothetical protein